MFVNNVQPVNYNVNFKAKVVDSSSLRKFRAGLNAADQKKLDEYIKQIEQSKNKKSYVFDYISIGSFKNIKRLAAINVQNKDRTIQHPPVFSAPIDSALSIFKNLAESLK